MTHYHLGCAHQLQIHPEEGSQTYNDFELADTWFTIVFTIELVINMTAHWCWPFWNDGWNVFDFIVVTVCLLATFSSELDVFKVKQPYKRALQDS